MSFDTIKMHWSNALDFFKLQNFKLFTLATLNNFLRSLKILFKEFTGLLIIMLVSKLCYAYYVEASRLLMGGSEKSLLNLFFILSLALFFVSTTLITFFFVLAARPSIELKNRRYFITHCVQFWGFVLLCFFIPQLFYPFLVMSILFFLDLKNRPISLYHAIKNGFKSYIYFLPVTFFLSVLFILPLHGIMYLDFLSQHFILTFATTQHISDFLIYFISFPTMIFIAFLLYTFLFTSACTIYYVKIKHAHHQLFFNQK